jgi:hypothetical protein
MRGLAVPYSFPLSHLGLFFQHKFNLSPSLTLANDNESAISRCPSIQTPSKENSPAFFNDDEMVTICFVAGRSWGLEQELFWFYGLCACEILTGRLLRKRPFGRRRWWWKHSTEVGFNITITTFVSRVLSDALSKAKMVWWSLYKIQFGRWWLYEMN